MDIMGIMGRFISASRRRRMDYTSFVRGGMKPWTRGYEVYKEESIKRVLADGGFDPGRLPKGYGFRIDERIVEYPWFLSRLPAGGGRLLDAGSALNHEYIAAQGKVAEKKLFIFTLAPESTAFWQRGISYVYEDLRDSCFRDEYFDWVVSISTVEHIGLDNTMLYTGDSSKNESDEDSYLKAIREFKRVLKPGGVLYLTLPFGLRKNRGWFQVFDAGKIDELVAAFAPSTASEWHFRYEPEGWRVSSRVESRDATCFDIHRQKEYDPDYAAFSRAVICMELHR